MRKPKRNRSGGGMLARLFVDRLERGVMVDRAKTKQGGRDIRIVPASAGMQKFKKAAPDDH